MTGLLTFFFHLQFCTISYARLLFVQATSRLETLRKFFPFTEESYPITLALLLNIADEVEYFAVTRVNNLGEKTTNNYI